MITIGIFDNLFGLVDDWYGMINYYENQQTANMEFN